MSMTAAVCDPLTHELHDLYSDLTGVTPDSPTADSEDCQMMPHLIYVLKLLHAY
jgi:hypothetical protein